MSKAQRINDNIIIVVYPHNTAHIIRARSMQLYTYKCICIRYTALVRDQLQTDMLHGYIDIYNYIYLGIYRGIYLYYLQLRVHAYIRVRLMCTTRSRGQRGNVVVVVSFPVPA